MHSLQYLLWKSLVQASRIALWTIIQLCSDRLAMQPAHAQYSFDELTGKLHQFALERDGPVLGGSCFKNVDIRSTISCRLLLRHVKKLGGLACVAAAIITINLFSFIAGGSSSSCKKYRQTSRDSDGTEISSKTIVRHTILLITNVFSVLSISILMRRFHSFFLCGPQTAAINRWFVVMDSGKKPENRNPRKGANPVSQLFFAWIVPLFWHGTRNGLNTEDLTKCLRKDKSDTLGNILEA